MTVADRLAELGLVLPDLSDDPLVHARVVTAGAHVFISGQLPVRDGTVVSPGRLGGAVSVEGGQEAARVATLNALALAQTELRRLDRVRVLQLTGYVAATPEFELHAEVLQGAEALLRDVLGDQNGSGARSVIGVASLPLRSPVQIELALYRDFTRPSGPRGR